MRKQKVVPRSKVRLMRRRRNGAALATALLAGLGFFALRQARLSGRSPRELLAALRVRSVEVAGAAAADRAGVQAALAGYIGAPLYPLSRAALSAQLAARFPALRVARVEKQWARLALVVTLAPRQALARCAEAPRGKASAGSAQYLDDAGEVFPAPAEPATLPLARGVCSGGAQARQDLASLLAQWDASDHGVLAVAEAEPAPGGWQLQLADGTKVLWGGPDATALKVKRLVQVVADAKTRYGGIVSADLRFFGEGKVVVKPLAAGKGAPGGAKI